MGCCGCNNKSSAITAGIFGMLQGISGLMFNVFFLNLYDSYPRFEKLEDLSTQYYLVYATSDVEVIVLTLIAIATILHIVWVISSIILLIGNSKNNACCVRQWVIWTSFVIIGDILLPIIFAASTYGTFVDVIESVKAKVQSSVSEDGGPVNRYIDSVASSFAIDVFIYYIFLLMCFCKLGIITIIINICLTVFTNRRATEISCPRGYVMASTVTVIQGQPSVPGMIAVGPGATVVTQAPIVYNTGFPQSGTTNPYYPGNIPLQPAVTFSTNSMNPSCVYPEGIESEAVCNPLTDPLIPPITKREF